MKRISFSLRVVLWFLLAATILLVNAIFIRQSFDKVELQKTRVDRTHQVISHLQEVVSGLKDVQAAQRCYIITGQQDYLAPYNVALPKIEERLDDLSKADFADPIQDKRLGELKQESAKRIEIAQQIIAAYEHEGQKAAFCPGAAGERQARDGSHPQYRGGYDQSEKSNSRCIRQRWMKRSI